MLLAGAMLTETIFSWPGIGKWLIDSIFRRDYPVVQGGLLLIAAIVMVVNLIVDLLYGLINPRIRDVMTRYRDSHRPPPCRRLVSALARVLALFLRQPRRARRPRHLCPDGAVGDLRAAACAAPTRRPVPRRLLLPPAWAKAAIATSFGTDPSAATSSRA